MCYVTEAQKKSIQSEIDTLKSEQTSNQAVIDDATTCLEENEAALAQADCAIEALEGMSLGSTKVLDNTNICKNELNARIALDKDIIEEANRIQEKIGAAITAKENELAAVPANCGSCFECNPDKGSNIG